MKPTITPVNPPKRQSFLQRLVNTKGFRIAYGFCYGVYLYHRPVAALASLYFIIFYICYSELSKDKDIKSVKKWFLFLCCAVWPIASIYRFYRFWKVNVIIALKDPA